MGSCVSVREDPESASFRFAMATKAGELLAPLPDMGWAPIGGGGLPPGGFDPKSAPEEAGLGFRSPRFGTKDETFFDSQEWFESDCEDDFFSVNGDFTPSRGTTPNYETVTPIKLQPHKAALTLHGFPEAKSEPAPRKTLAELLQETMPGDPAGNEQNTVDGKIQVNEKSESNTPDGNFRDGKQKRGKAKQCCLPSLVHSLSFNEKKRMPSPRRHSVGQDTS